MVSSQIVNLVSDTLFLEGLQEHVNLAGDLMVTSALAATTYHWALEQHAQGIFTPLDFVVEKYAPVYVKMKAIFTSISSSPLYSSFVQTVVQRGRSLLGDNL